jgi:molybdate transport system substrate-binding protein
MKKMKHFFRLAPLFVLVITGCSPAAMPSVSAPETRTLNVFAAASLTDAFTEIGKDFEGANPGVAVTFNFAGSQALRTQIEEGAPADVFASANKTEMDNLITGTFVRQNAPQIFLNNRLVVILPADNPAMLEKLDDLARRNIKLVLAAEEVPVGKYTRQALDQMNRQFGSDFKDKVLANVVSYEDNVKQVVAKVQLGEGDAGIVYTSDAVAVPDLKTIEVPLELNVVASYPIAPLAKSPNADLARAFIEYIVSPDAQAVLQKWGFAPVE